MSNGRPAITITANSMIHAQAATLTQQQKVEIHAWADRVQAAREARGEMDARPNKFSVPVRDSIGVLIGHVVYPT